MTFEPGSSCCGFTSDYGIDTYFSGSAFQYLTEPGFVGPRRLGLGQHSANRVLHRSLHRIAPIRDAFPFCRGADVVLYSMRFGLIGLASLVCLMLAGCATKQYATLAAAAIQRTFQEQNDSRMWREQLERQQRIAREAGRIGYIGNAGPAFGTSSSGVSLN